MDRRTFLRNSVLGAAAVTLVPLGLRGQIAKRAMKPGRLNLSFTPHELHLRHAFNLAKSSRTVTPDMLVRIEFDGIIGYGEASMPPYLGESEKSVCNFLSQLDLTQFNDPFRIGEIHRYMDIVSNGNYAAKCVVDIALHDIVGKITGQPWHRMWGLSAADAPCTSFTIGIDTPEVVRQKVQEASPYRVLKVKMGLDRDKETVELIRSMTDVPICADVNQGWIDRKMALDMCHWLADRGCLFVEQPFDKTDVKNTMWLREHSPLPIIADEAVQLVDDVRRIADVYDGINIKLMKCGGMHQAHEMAVVAKALGLKVMLGCMTETSCAVTAAAQLAPMADWADLDGNLLITNDPFDGLKIVDGKITLPSDRPGIGVVEI